MTKRVIRVLLVLILCLCAAAGVRAGERGHATKDNVRWNTLTSSHYDVFYESSWPPSGLILDLERIYSTLRMTLANLGAGQSDRKIKVYIYKSKETYLTAPSKPPQWSVAIAIYADSTIIMYDPKNTEKLRNTIAHESTHIILHDYFRRAAKPVPIPVWFNEGMATLVEDTVSGGTAWSKSLEHFKNKNFMPLNQMLYSDPGTDSSGEAASIWYLEAFSLAKFLSRPEKKIQFAALADNYRYNSIIDFEAAWLKWIETFTKNSEKNNTAFTSAEFTPFRTNFSNFAKPANFRRPEELQ